MCVCLESGGRGSGGEGGCLFVKLSSEGWVTKIWWVGVGGVKWLKIALKKAKNFRPLPAEPNDKWHIVIFFFIKNIFLFCFFCFGWVG